MSTIKTHISTSGQRVACSALSRPCPRGGHETTVVGGKKEQAFQAAAARAVTTTPAPPLSASYGKAVAKMIATRVSKGFNEAQSTELFNSLLASHDGENLSYALVYNNFASEGQAQLFLSRQEREKFLQETSTTAPFLAEMHSVPSISKTSRFQPQVTSNEEGFMAAAARQASGQPIRAMRQPRKFFADDDVLDKRSQAKTSHDSALLTTLSRDKDKITVIGVATNTNLPATDLARLAKHKDWGVRAAVAANRATPASVKEVLRNDSEKWVRDAVK